MRDQRITVSPQQLAEAQQALDISALNGIVSLAIIFKKRGLIEEDELRRLHDALSKPLIQAFNANNPLVQDAQHNLDELFSTIMTVGK